MTVRLPPLAALRAFDAAARNLSFKLAAEELNVTPAAISQQIRTLEDDCGVALFHRKTRAIALTEAGHAAAPLMAEGFARLAEAVAAMRATVPSRVLTVSLPPSFAAKWLVPRLERFNQRHPDFDVRIEASDGLARFSTDGVDMAVRYGRGDYPGLTAQRLMSETTAPVCSPGLLERGPALETPADLRHHRLLHVRWKVEREAAPNWRMWLRAAGAGDVDSTRGPQFSNDSLAVQAAIGGQGVALGEYSLVQADVEAGRLVRPFGDVAAQDSAFSYFVVYPPDKDTDPKVADFRDWLLDEASAALADGG